MKLIAVISTSLLVALPPVTARAVRTTNISPQIGIDYGILEGPSGCGAGGARGSARISQEFANALLSNADLPSVSPVESFPPAEGSIIQTRLLTENLRIHTDYEVESSSPVGKGSLVAFIPVNDNLDAFFVYGHERIPLVKDQMYEFDGSVEHGIIIESGNVQLLGPFILPSMARALEAPITPCSTREVKDCCNESLNPTDCKICATSGETCGATCVDPLDDLSSFDTCYNCVSNGGGGWGWGMDSFVSFTQGELEDVASSQDHLHKIVRNLRGNMEGNFDIVQDLLPPNELGNLRSHADSALETAILKLSAGEEDEGEDILEDFQIELSPSELASLISPESIQSMYDAFRDFGNGVPVSRIVMRRTNLNGDKHIKYHSDGDSVVMHIWLNEDSIEGGNLVYLNKDGVTKVETKPGAASLHKEWIVHGITPLNGTRYILVLVGDGSKVQYDFLESMVA